MERSESPACSSYRGRDIPWLQVVRFHREIVERGEESFFSLDPRDPDAERWTSLRDFEPPDLAGPWRLPLEALVSSSFRRAAEASEHTAIFLGGPCTYYFARRSGARWRPLLYREVRARVDEDWIELVPEEGTWSLTPLIHGVLERVQASAPEGLEHFAGQVLERATVRALESSIPLSVAVLKAAIELAPDLEAELTRNLFEGRVREYPTPWILFAPTSSFSPLTRNLLNDYGRLEQILERDPERSGGLRILEDLPPAESGPEDDVLPMVPLDAAQERAVRAMLARQPLTVVSGPPGCGKSQVVVAVLLNAWARGMKVLFASNNNQAVDVVRQRLEAFEAEFPIAVRAGNREKSRAKEVLRQALNLVARVQRGAKDEFDAESVQSARLGLQEEIEKCQKALASEVPHRVSEAVAAALSAYGQYREILATIMEREEELRESFTALGRSTAPPEEAGPLVEQSRRWLEKLAQTRLLAEEDDRKRRSLEAQARDLERRREAACAEVGLDGSTMESWGWLLGGPRPERLQDWAARFAEWLSEPVEESLESLAWRPEYDRWGGTGSARACAQEADDLIARIHQAEGELGSCIREIGRVTRRLSRARLRLIAAGLDTETVPPAEVLDAWAAAWAEVSTRRRGRWDFLPWSAVARQRRVLSSVERQLRSVLPLATWRRVGRLDDSGRRRLAEVVERCRDLVSARARQDRLRDDISRVEGAYGLLRAGTRALGLGEVPTPAGPEDLEAWALVADRAKNLAALAREAGAAWARRERRDSAQEQLLSLVREFLSLGSGLPIWESWVRGKGAKLLEAIETAAATPDPERVASCRTALYATDLAGFIAQWHTAIEAERERQNVLEAAEGLPSRQSRVGQWWADRPARLVVKLAQEADCWPDEDALKEDLGELEDWLQRWTDHSEKQAPSDRERARQELAWAVERLEKAVEELPEGKERFAVEEILRRIQNDPEQDWPVEELRAAFQAFGPERLQGRIRRLEAELEQVSFKGAKAAWLARLEHNDAVLRAVDRVQRVLARRGGRLPEEEYGAFRLALDAVPIWITTAQAPQSIPLEPELYDLVVIDEASQCTVTNLLPLMYRGKRLAVIGDENQLRAIPTIQPAEELMLARRHQIEDLLHVVGHAENDVYTSACECLPRRRADVVMLTDHYRSHPQIIGFANARIYQRQLLLQRRPDEGGTLALGSGVHARHVRGSAKRGRHGQSWFNLMEADAVVEQVRQLREGSAGRAVKIGVVTPFSEQKRCIQELLARVGQIQDVTVGTAHTFQGDERDVMIFSPVVAAGISPGACRWVETPPNLINVAVTRARDALLVVGDLDFCEAQEGILRGLARYCRTVELLRETSAAELELFSWMCLRGWSPDVHTVVGDVEVDFVLRCNDGTAVAIEVDGEAFHADRKQRDKARDAFLAGRGFRVHRVPARAVIETPFRVINDLAVLLEKDSPG